MAKKNILTIGFDVCDKNTQYCKFNSDLSLLDWDIVLYKPVMEYNVSYENTFQGKPCLSDDSSFKLKNQVEHWRREIKSTVDSGRNVFVFLTDLEEVFIATGEKQFSGTGKNQKTTRIVDIYNNYKSIPASLNPVKTKGQEMKLSAKNSEVISSYWNEFSSYSRYKVIFNEEVTPCLTTKHGDKPVGAIIHSKTSIGNLVLIPDIDFYSSEFFNDEDQWSKEAKDFGSKFVKSIISLDKSLRSTTDLTPEPEWAKDDEYKLDEESVLTSKLLKVESKLEKFQAEKESFMEEIKKLGKLRGLLFEKGKPLEYAIIDALKVLGFSVSQHNDGESEFDAVFQSKEVRLIGEVEGKDNKAINIEKLRQLSLNIYEDLERDEVEQSAKAVLFGNPFRLHPIVERKNPFTTKCISATKTTSTALVFTPDLFEVTKYLMDKNDIHFAEKCRKSLLNTIGRVKFPTIPKSKLIASQISKVEHKK